MFYDDALYKSTFYLLTYLCGHVNSISFYDAELTTAHISCKVHNADAANRYYMNAIIQNFKTSVHRLRLAVMCWS